MEQIKFYKVRDFGETLNVVVEFISQNFKPLSLCVILFSGPFFLITGMLNGNSLSSVADLFGIGSTTLVGQNPLLALPSGLLMLLAISILVATVYSYLRLYNQGEKEISPSKVWSLGKKDILMVLISFFGFGIIAGIATLFLVIPGIYVGVVLFQVYAVQAHERLSFTKAISRCFDLIKENWWVTFGLLFVAYIIRFIISLIFAIPSTIITFVLGTSSLDLSSGGAVPGIVQGFLYLLNGLAMVGDGWSTMLIYLVAGFQYYNLVERKEAVGLMKDIDTFGSGETSPEPEEHY